MVLTNFADSDICTFTPALIEPNTIPIEMDSDSHHDNNEAELDDRIGDIIGIDSGKLKY